MLDAHVTLSCAASPGFGGTACSGMVSSSSCVDGVAFAGVVRARGNASTSDRPLRARRCQHVVAAADTTAATSADAAADIATAAAAGHGHEHGGGTPPSVGTAGADDALRSTTSDVSVAVALQTAVASNMDEGAGDVCSVLGPGAAVGAAVGVGMDVGAAVGVGVDVGTDVGVADGTTAYSEALKKATIREATRVMPLAEKCRWSVVVSSSRKSLVSTYPTNGSVAAAARRAASIVVHVSLMPRYCPADPQPPWTNGMSGVPRDARSAKMKSVSAARYDAVETPFRASISPWIHSTPRYSPCAPP